MVYVTIRLGELEVTVQSTESHPDHLNDLTNRAIIAFTNALSVAKETGVSLYGDEPEIDLDEE
jgi:hypothetical protein